MKNFLVVRNEKKQNIEVLEFDSMAEARKEKMKRRQEGHKGELVVAFGKDMESFLESFTEYRPANWKDLIK